MKGKSKTETPVWVIRAGKAGERGSAHELFTQKNILVLAKQDMGDLRRLPKAREAFYAAYSSGHEEEGRTAIAGIGGKFFRFIHEIKAGDLVLYPCRLDKQVYFGEAVGSYFYDAECSPQYPHSRRIRWIGSFPKAKLSEGAVRELGAARTLFRFKSNVEEVRQLVSKTGKPNVHAPRRSQAAS